MVGCMEIIDRYQFEIKQNDSKAYFLQVYYIKRALCAYTSLGLKITFNRDVIYFV
jgi:hypothetical protein